MTLTFESTGDGPPVVLVPGASPVAWGSVPQRLAARGHRAITYARRGYPPNDHLGLASSLREHTDDLAELLSECGPSAVVGWSSGGVVALDLALRSPKLATRIVVIEAPLHARYRPTFGTLRAVVGAQLEGRKDPAKGAQRFLTWALGRYDGRSSDIGRLDPAALRRAAPAIVNELGHATGEREIATKELRQLAVDTSWLVGTASVPNNRRLARRAARRSPRITITEVAGAGHAIALDAPDEVVRAVTSSEPSTSNVGP